MSKENSSGLWGSLSCSCPDSSSVYSWKWISYQPGQAVTITFESQVKPDLTSNSCAPCSFISETKSAIGRGMRGGKFFLESVTSVGHSSSGGKPITLKWHIIFNETDILWIIYQYFSLSGKYDGKIFVTHSKIFPSWSTSDSPQNNGLIKTKQLFWGMNTFTQADQSPHAMCHFYQ